MTLTTHELQSFRLQLIERRQQLEIASEESRDQRSASAVHLDPSSVGRLSRMDALQVQAMAQALEANRAEELLRISAALQRIENDEFGICLMCYDDIALPRLQLDPSYARCVACADLE